VPGLIGPDDVRRIADAALELRGVDGVEVLFVHEWGGLTRFAASSIHQSTWREDTGIRIRAVSGGRVGVASTNEFTKEGARRAADSAKEMAEVASPDPLFPGLAPEAPTEAADRFDDVTASTTPEQRADTIRSLVAQCADGFHAAGAYDTSAAEVGLVNTDGQFSYAANTQASITTVVSGGDGGSGFAEQLAGSSGEIDAEGVGRRAAGKAGDSQRPQDLDPGDYQVVLEPPAVATLVAFLAYMGLGGRSLIEGRSCFAGREGEQVAAPSISIYDDALSPETLGLPFDFEGTPKRRVDLIRDGVFVDAVYDRRSGRQVGKESTGHALPPPNPEGPFPLNLFMAPGDASVEEMIAATDRGILVTRFHYSNVVHPKESIITGMTRDGTFLIEGGAVQHPVKNFRFTQSIIEALRAVEMVGRDTSLASEFFFAASRVPALKIAGFRFTGRSDH
jgi:predicted Zn-dependent protease